MMGIGIADTASTGVSYIMSNAKNNNTVYNAKDNNNTVVSNVLEQRQDNNRCCQGIATIGADTSTRREQLGMHDQRNGRAPRVCRSCFRSFVAFFVGTRARPSVEKGRSQEYCNFRKES